MTSTFSPPKPLREEGREGTSMPWTRKMGGEEAGGGWQRAVAAYGSSWPWRRPGRPPVTAMAARRRHGRSPIAAVDGRHRSGRCRRRRGRCHCRRSQPWPPARCRPLVAVVPNHGRADVGLVAARVWEKKMRGDWGRRT
jgi:hypothetical protein